jgi:hypothetical protein
MATLLLWLNNPQKTRRNLMQEINYCAYIKNCHDHPFEKQPQLTVRQFEELKTHASKCEECAYLIDKTIKDNPKKSVVPFSQN